METRSMSGWAAAAIHAGAGLFGLALLVSAIFDPTIRVLHTLQALLYLAVVVLTGRESPWGFGAGAVMGTFWNAVNLFVTNFIVAGINQLWSWLGTGTLERPDLLIAVVAGTGHLLLVVGCLVGFACCRPRGRDWVKFIAGGAAAIAYFVAIIVTTGPQYIPLLRRVFRIPG